MRLAENSLSVIVTRCLQAGVEFSFRSAFGESWGLVKLLQIDALKAGQRGFEPM
jgi:hypothetical protein